MKDEQSENDEEEICWVEIVLYDVLHNIFKYLNIYDLNQASRVCKSWFEAARLEKLKRGPQIMILQAFEELVATGFSDVRLADVEKQVDDFKLALRIKPRLGLFFTDGRYPSSADCDSVPFEICNAHTWTQPESSFYVALETLGVNFDAEPVAGERNLTGAVFLPERPGLNYVLAEASSYRIERSAAALGDLADELFAATRGSGEYESDNACFLVFIYQWRHEPSRASHHDAFLRAVLDKLKSRYRPGTYSLWGGAVNDVYAVAGDRSRSALRHSTSFCAARLSGPALASWSLSLRGELSSAEIAAKLRDFKTRVRLRSTSLAFLILPTTASTNHADKDVGRGRTRVFNDAFPGVKLVSIFNDDSQAVLSVDSNCDEQREQELKHVNRYAYLIITYK